MKSQAASQPEPPTTLFAAIDPILGYLNYGNGSFDVNFFKNLDIAFGLLGADSEAGKTDDFGPLSISSGSNQPSQATTPSGDPEPTDDAISSEDAIEFKPPPEKPDAHPLTGCTAFVFFDQLTKRLADLKKENSAFRESSQSQFAIEVTFDVLMPKYLKFHRDLFFHQTTELLLNSFFVGRAFELVLREIRLRELDSTDAFAAIDQAMFSRAVLRQLNDFTGHRPVATLESQKREAYANERFRPVPVYIQGVGVAAGRYHALLTETFRLIENTDKHILRAAQFSLERLQELAVDPRAFDFDHPVNQRPNHHFGQWDGDTISLDGYFERFILHAVTLEALLDRIEDCSTQTPPIPYDQALMEAASALACTMLMGSGIAGSSPSTYDSNTTLGTLIPVIAGYRDTFYHNLLASLKGPHQARLLEESKQRHQPFGAVRQDLNARLAHHRAMQLVNCRLATIFARMGYPDAATKQSKIVPVTSARIHCQIDCLLATANDAIEANNLEQAFSFVHKIFARLKTGIGCGAIVDPWNIIGFDANYSLFPAMENTVRDHRVFDLLDIMDRIFALLSRITSEAAATDNDNIREDADKEMRLIVDWWRKYAAHEVSAVGAVDPEDLYEAASTVSKALSLWHKGGAAAGDMEFWAPHAEILDSPKAYTLVIDALIQKQDYQTCSALLVHWISQSDLVPLELGDSSFHNLMFRWIAEQRVMLQSANFEERQTIWNRIRKFYDFLEVNAGDYWQVPSFSLAPERFKKHQDQAPSDADLYAEFDEIFEDVPDDEPDELFRAAYDDVTYNDSTNDGVEGEVHDGGFALGDDSLEAEVDRIQDRLEFLGTLASFWCVAARIPLATVDSSELNDQVSNWLKERRQFVNNWVQQAVHNRQQLLILLASINAYKIQINGSDRDAMVLYDQQRLNKDLLMEHTINTCIETENAIRMLASVGRAIDHLLGDQRLDVEPEADSSQEVVDPVNDAMPIVKVYAALVLRDPNLVNQHFDDLLEYLHSRTPLYVPLSKGGKPSSIVKARVLQSGILDLLGQLPALGLCEESFRLTQTTLEMERNNPVGGGAVTEFDEIFEVAYASMVEVLAVSTAELKKQRFVEPDANSNEIKAESRTVLFDCIEMLTEAMLPMWLDHSKTLRLSTLEKVRKPVQWDGLVNFIKTYGEGLFTQSFFHLGNVRAILHQGVDTWLQQVQDSPNCPDLRLFDELGSELSRETAVRYLTLVLESVRENFNEYVDYNTTTTQSDHGESLYSFLDFLRLRSRYDRICWHLKPVVWAHRILVRRQANGVALMWRRSLNERVGVEAEKYLELLGQLRQKYSIQMNSVGRRLEGKFAHQLQIDRLRALVEPAMSRPRSRQSQKAFDLLQIESQAFLRSTSGVGVDLPEWLAELENEVQQFLLPRRLRDFWHQQSAMEVPPIPIAQLREKIEKLPRRS